MSETWNEGEPPEPLRIIALGWLLILLRASLLGAVVFGGLLVLLLVLLLGWFSDSS